MKVNLIFTLLITIFLCSCQSNANQSKNNREEGKGPEIDNPEQDEAKAALADLDLVGYWKNEQCKLGIEIFQDGEDYYYEYSANHTYLSGEMSITQEGTDRYFNFENLAEHVASEVTALYNVEEESFVIQNTGNAMNEYTLLKDGCTKYLEFRKQGMFTDGANDVITKYVLDDYLKYKLLDLKKGDMDKDGFDEYVIVLESIKPMESLTNMEDGHHRKVVILDQFGIDKYGLLAENNELVDCSSCGGAGVGDPFQGISITNNYFSIEQLYGACQKDFVVTTFKYTNLDYFLHKIGTESYNCNAQTDDGEIEIKKKTLSTKDFGEVHFGEYSWNAVK